MSNHFSSAPNSAFCWRNMTISPNLAVPKPWATTETLVSVSNFQATLFLVTWVPQVLPTKPSYYSIPLPKLVSKQPWLFNTSWNKNKRGLAKQRNSWPVTWGSSSTLFSQGCPKSWAPLSLLVTSICEEIVPGSRDQPFNGRAAGGK